jgi:hypothetical protein
MHASSSARGVKHTSDFYRAVVDLVLRMNELSLTPSSHNLRTQGGNPRALFEGGSALKTLVCSANFDMTHARESTLHHWFPSKHPFSQLVK